MKPGDRVGAICSANKEEVQLYGYGVYDGRIRRSLDTPGVFGTGHEMIETARRVYKLPDDLPLEQWPETKRKAIENVLSNPRITLDNGDVVWGCQCWWAEEEKVKASIGNRRVVIVPVPGKETANVGSGSAESEGPAT